MGQDFPDPAGNRPSEQLRLIRRKLEKLLRRQYGFLLDEILPELLKPYPIIMYDYMDQGPFSDILERLHIPADASRMVTSSRAANYEVLANTDAYFLNSDYNVPLSKCARQTYPYPHRTLTLKDCSIHSEIGWIKRADTPLSPIAQEAVDLFYEYFQH